MLGKEVPGVEPCLANQRSMIMTYARLNSKASASSEQNIFSVQKTVVQETYKTGISQAECSNFSVQLRR